MTKVRPILFVEDNAFDAELAVGALSEYGFANQIVVVSDGVEALDYLYHRGAFEFRAPGDPALILLDIKMPKMDGLEVLEVIKKDEQLRFIPVVMLTSSREEPDLVRSYQLGVNSYVVKPVDFKAFADAIKDLGFYWTVHNQPLPESHRPAD